MSNTCFLEQCVQLARLCRIARLKALFTVEERLRTHDFNGAMIRGAFGAALHALHRGRGAYETLFEPELDSEGLRLLPYRLRNVSGERMLMEPGTLFQFGVDLFGVGVDYVLEVTQALAWMGFSGLGPEHARLQLRSVWQELPDGTCSVIWLEQGGSQPTIHTTLADYPLPQAGRYLLTLKSPTVFRSNGQPSAPTLTLMAESATRRMARFAGLDVSHRPHVHMKGHLVWSKERTFARSSRREGEQQMHGWVGAYDVAVQRPGEAAPLWAAKLIGVGRHTTFGFGDVELDTIDAYSIPSVNAATNQTVHVTGDHK